MQGKADEQLVLAVCSRSAVHHVPFDQVSQILISSSSAGQSHAESTSPSRKRIKKEEREGQIGSGSSTATGSVAPHTPVLSIAVRQELVPLPNSSSLISYKVCIRVVQK